MTDSIESWLGKSVTREDEITPRLLQQYLATLAPHLHVPANADECPPGLHWCLALPAHDAASLGPDGAEAKGVFLPPVPLPRRMWAGGKVESLLPLRVGDRVKRVSTITDIKQRTGQSGALCFISVQHEISTISGLAVRERHDILYREQARSEGAKAMATRSPTGELRWDIDASPLLLFRFSAVTFNGHRIHYDLPYATETEGYGGLLVHGPMQAALTLNQASALWGRVPAVFNYRCTAPLIAGQIFAVQSWREGSSVKSAITDAASVLTIEAEALG